MWVLPSVKTWMEGTHDIPYKNLHIFHDYWTKSDGISSTMQMISYSFIILKHFLNNPQFWKLLMVRVCFFLFIFLGGARSSGNVCSYGEDFWQCSSTLKALSHLADLARRSYTGAQICWFSGIGTSTAAQRYHIVKNGRTSSGHRQNIGDKISNGRRR